MVPSSHFYHDAKRTMLARLATLRHMTGIPADRHQCRFHCPQCAPVKKM